MYNYVYYTNELSIMTYYMLLYQYSDYFNVLKYTQVHNAQKCQQTGR